VAPVTEATPPIIQTEAPAPVPDSGDALPPIPPVETATKTEIEAPVEEKKSTAKEKKKGPGCFKIIKRLACLTVVLFLLLIAGIIALIIFKPSFVTEPLKIFLNGEYNPQTSDGVSQESVDGYIDEVTNAENGEVTFQLTEEQLNTLVRSRISRDLDLRTEVVPNSLRLHVDVASTGGPLWVVFELSESSGQLNVSRLGLGRINSPSIFREFLKDQAFRLIGSLSEDLRVQSSEELVNSLIEDELRTDVTIQNVEFREDLVVVTVEL
jgi:hypothetical protein